MSIEIKNKHITSCNNCDFACTCDSIQKIACINGLLEFRKTIVDKFNSGQLQEFKCVINDPIYHVNNDNVEVGYISTITLKSNGNIKYRVIFSSDHGSHSYEITEDDFGKTYFLTMDEAECVSKTLSKQISIFDIIEEFENE